MRRRASLLFYCQHSLGMGHLVRSLALAASLAERFHVCFLNGGPLPKGVKIPTGVELINLPPLGLDAEGQLVSRDRRRSLPQVQSVRRQMILDTFISSRPQVIFIELFPFGRKKFTQELLPLLDAANEARPFRPIVCCSLRDILVGKKSDQQKHDERAVRIANEYFDTVMVHSDPAFARLEESLVSHASLRTPVYYTGFVQPGGVRAAGPVRKRQRQILVSAGGGLVGEKLFRTAIEAYPLLARTCDMRMKIVTGPFLPKEAWDGLRAAVSGQPRLSLKRFVPDLSAEMRASIASVSQGGYNTTLDILRAGIPSLVVPFSDGAEDEQLKRARRLASLGAIRVMEQQEMTEEHLALEMRGLLDFKPQRLDLDLNGADNTARIVESLTGARHQFSWGGLTARRLCGGASMSGWLNELRRALDAAPTSISFFFRDDDAGWGDGRLFELLDMFERHSLPIDVAAIPTATTYRTATELRARIEAGPSRLAVHQHGFAHSNHEREGRKCEFGGSREPLLQQRDIESGRERLLDLFGPRLSPIFTPPWNRCTTITGECLQRAGFHILSRDSTARPLNLEGLFEMPVTVDWFARAKGVRLSPDCLGGRIAEAARSTAPVGIMFHHALMDECERRRAGEMLSLLARHENARCYLMEQLVSQLSEDNSLSVAETSAAWQPHPAPRPTSAERK